MRNHRAARSVLFNLLAMLGGDGGRVVRDGLLQGYTNIVWLLVLNNAHLSAELSRAAKRAPLSFMASSVSSWPTLILIKLLERARALQKILRIRRAVTKTTGS